MKFFLYRVWKLQFIYTFRKLKRIEKVTNTRHETEQKSNPRTKIKNSIHKQNFFIKEYHKKDTIKGKRNKETEKNVIFNLNQRNKIIKKRVKKRKDRY